MATKEFNFKPRTFVNSKFKQDPLCCNLNLNSNSNFNSKKTATVSSKTDGVHNQRNTFCHDIPFNERVGDKKDSLWKNKSSESWKRNVFDSGEESRSLFGKKNEATNAKVSVSTLSLHIAAFENSIEATSDDSTYGTDVKAKEKKRNSLSEKFGNIIIQSPFEFPRQQENEEAKTPEISQFQASQSLLTPNSSKGRAGRPKGSANKKTLTKDTNRQNVSQRYTPLVLESLDEQQLYHYNIAMARAEKAERELVEEKHRTEELQKQNSLLQRTNQEQAKEMVFEKEARKAAVQNYEKEKEQRIVAEHNVEIVTSKMKANEKRSADSEKELQKQILKLQKESEEQRMVIKCEKDKNEGLHKTLLEMENERATLLKCEEKLQSTLKEIAAANRSLKIKIEEAEEKQNHLETENEKLRKALEKFKKPSDTTKMKMPTIHKNQPLNKLEGIPYEISSSRTQQRRVQKTVQELKAIPEMAEKVLARFKSKDEKVKQKISPLQAVTIAVLLGFNPNQLEILKTYLRHFKLDILPPVHLMRKALKTMKEDFAYIEFEDKDIGVVGRRVTSVKNVIQVRGGRIMEAGRWVDVPNFERYAFVGLTADSGGGFLHCSVSIMNVDEGWGSPNNGTLVASGKIKTEDYEAVKYICGDSFKELNELDGTEIEFQVNGVTVTKTLIVIVCFDGKMGSICSGHSGASSAMPCYSCILTKKDINNGLIGALRNAVTMLQQATKFEEKKGSMHSETKLSKLRSECECITKPPLLTIPYTQWIYGILHAAMGPVIKALDIIEDDATRFKRT